MLKFVLFLAFMMSSVSAKAITAKHFRLVWQTDPATEIDVGWTTTLDNWASRHVVFGRIDRGPTFARWEHKVTAPIPRRKEGLDTCFVRLKELRPDTVYWFRIVEEGNFSEAFHFRTMPADLDKLSLVAGSDSRNNRRIRINGNMLVAKLRPHAVIFAGDFVATGGRTQWSRWFEDWQKSFGIDGRITPIVPGRGNHERSNKVLSVLFNLPEKNRYSVTFGRDLLSVYALNTEDSIAGEQSEWLEKSLKRDADSSWRMAFYHRPMRPHTTGKRNGQKQYAAWAKLFYDYRVGVVLEGDSHMAKTTWPLRPSTSATAVEGFVEDLDRGTVYMGEGCWGAPLRPANKTHDWTRRAGSLNQFKWLHVNRSHIDLRTLPTDQARDIGYRKDSERFAIPVRLRAWAPNGNDEVIRIEKRAL